MYNRPIVATVPATNFYLANQWGPPFLSFPSLPGTNHEPSTVPVHANSPTAYVSDIIPSSNDINLQGPIVPCQTQNHVPLVPGNSVVSNPTENSRQVVNCSTPSNSSLPSALRPQDRHPILSHTLSEPKTTFDSTSRDAIHTMQHSPLGRHLGSNSPQENVTEIVTAPNTSGITTLDLTNGVPYSKGDLGSHGNVQIERVKPLKPNSVPFEYRTPSRSPLGADSSTSSAVAQRPPPSSHSRLSSSSQRRTNVATSSHNSNSTPNVAPQSAIVTRASPTPPLQSSVTSTAGRKTAPRRRRYATPNTVDKSSDSHSKQVLRTQVTSRSYFKSRSQSIDCEARGKPKTIAHRPPLPRNENSNQSSYPNLSTVKSVHQPALLPPTPPCMKATSSQVIASKSSSVTPSDSAMLSNGKTMFQTQAPDRMQPTSGIKSMVPSKVVSSQGSNGDEHTRLNDKSEISVATNSCALRHAKSRDSVLTLTEGNSPTSDQVQEKVASNTRFVNSTLAMEVEDSASQRTPILEVASISDSNVQTAQKASTLNKDSRPFTKTSSSPFQTHSGDSVQGIPLASLANGFQDVPTKGYSGDSQQATTIKERKRRVFKRKRAVLDESGDDAAPPNVSSPPKKPKVFHSTATPPQPILGNDNKSAQTEIESASPIATASQMPHDPPTILSRTVKSSSTKSGPRQTVELQEGVPTCNLMAQGVSHFVIPPDASCATSIGQNAGQLPSDCPPETNKMGSTAEGSFDEKQGKVVTQKSNHMGASAIGAPVPHIPVRLPLKRSGNVKEKFCATERVNLFEEQKSSDVAHEETAGVQKDIHREEILSVAKNDKISEPPALKASAAVDRSDTHVRREVPDGIKRLNAMSPYNYLSKAKEGEHDKNISRLDKKRGRSVQEKGRAEKRQRLNHPARARTFDRYKIPLQLRIKSPEKVPKSCLTAQLSQVGKRRRVVRFADGVQPPPLPQETDSVSSSEELRKNHPAVPSRERRIVRTRLSRIEAGAFNFACLPVLGDRVQPSPRVSYSRCCMCGGRLVSGVSHPLFDVRFMRICKDCRDLVLSKLMLTDEVNHLPITETNYNVNGQKADFFVAVIETMVLTYRRSERERRQVSLAYDALMTRPRQYVIERMKRLFVCYEMVPIACALLSRIGVQIRRGKVSWPMDGFRMAPHDAVDIVRSAWPQTMEHLKEGVFPSDMAWAKHCPDVKLDEEPWSCTVIMQVLDLIGVKVRPNSNCKHDKNEDGQCFVEVELASVLGALLRGGGWATDHEITALFAHNWAYKEVLYSLRGEDLEKAGHHVPEELLPSGCCICGNEHSERHYPLRFAECKTCKRRFCSPCLTNVLGGNDYVVAFRDDSYQCALCRLGSNQAVFPRGEANIAKVDSVGEERTAVEVIVLDSEDNDNAVTTFDQNCNHSRFSKSNAIGGQDGDKFKKKGQRPSSARRPISSLMKISGRVTHSRSAKSAVPAMMKLSFARRRDLLQHSHSNTLRLKAVGFAKLCEAANDRVLNGGKTVERRDCELICFICKMPCNYVEEKSALGEAEDDEIIEVDDIEVVHCGVSQCSNVVHKRCMSNIDRSRLGTEKSIKRRKGSKERWRCGHHYCSVCEGKDENKMLKCRTCPQSFCRDHVPSINSVSLFNDRLMICANCGPHIAPPKRAWSTDLRKSSSRRRSLSATSLGLAIMSAQHRGELRNFVQNK